MTTNGFEHFATTLDKFIWDCLIEKDYQFVPKDKFKAATILEQPIFTHKMTIGKTIYETQMSCDFILYHPTKHKDCLIIESKWQQSGGTVDEKFPYFILNIQQRYTNKTIVVIDGGGYRKEAETWIRKQIGNNLLSVFSMVEFKKWINKGNI